MTIEPTPATEDNACTCCGGPIEYEPLDFGVLTDEGAVALEALVWHIVDDHAPTVWGAALAANLPKLAEEHPDAGLGYSEIRDEVFHFLRGVLMGTVDDIADELGVTRRWQ